MNFLMSWGLFGSLGLKTVCAHPGSPVAFGNTVTISPYAMFCRKPCRTEIVQTKMHSPHTMLLTSAREGRIRMGTPIAMNRPCFQLTERFNPPSACSSAIITTHT